MKLYSRPRTPTRLSDSVHHQLNMYALAASAAGVGALALAQPAEAKIVYTKTHQVLRNRGEGEIKLDLNHDGIVDFIIAFNCPYDCQWSRLAIFASRFSNSVQGSYSASALPAGVVIGGPGGAVRPLKTAYGDLMEACGFTTEGGYVMRGPWLNVRNRYLGLGFHINGKLHYGWARLNASAQHEDQSCSMRATLTGYAYEPSPARRSSLARRRARMWSQCNRKPHQPASGGWR